MEQGLGRPTSRAEEPSEVLWPIPTVTEGSERGRDCPKVTQWDGEALHSQAQLTLCSDYTILSP